jgi:hypothetical protein
MQRYPYFASAMPPALLQTAVAAGCYRIPEKYAQDKKYMYSA